MTRRFLAVLCTLLLAAGAAWGQPSGSAASLVVTQPSGSGGSAFLSASATGGTANAIVLSDVAGGVINPNAQPSVSFGAEYTNTGATTLTVGGIGPYPVKQNTPAGQVALTGGEIVALTQATVSLVDPPGLWVLQSSCLANCSIAGTTTLGSTGGGLTVDLVSATTAAVLSSASTFSTGELLLTNSLNGQNVLSLANNNASGYAALTGRGDDGHEHFALGEANPSTNYCGVAIRCDYLEVSDYQGGTNTSSFTASISGTTLTVTGTPTGLAIGVGETVAGTNVAALTAITALGTGTGGTGTYTVSVSQTVSSEAMTAGYPPLPFEFHRTGFQQGSYQGLVSARVENAYTTNGIEGRWTWPSQNGASSLVALIDPINDYLGVNYRLVVGPTGGGQTGVAPLDVYGAAIIGTNTSTYRASDCATVLCVDQSATDLMRLVHTSVGKVSLSFYGANTSDTTRGLQFVDLDNSSVVPFYINMAGGLYTTNAGPTYYTGVVKTTPLTGATVTFAATQRTALVVPAGTLATLTVTLPACASANNGDERWIITSQIITALTVSAAAGSVVSPPAVTTAGGHYMFHCYGADTAWY
jgi:hypothetical protein